MRGVAEQSAVAAFAHIGDDALDRGKHGIKRCAAAAFERCKQRRRLLRTSPFGSD